LDYRKNGVIIKNGRKGAKKKEKIGDDIKKGTMALRKEEKSVI
jgi:hypothetical protein